jgi:hypothetical protein
MEQNNPPVYEPMVPGPAEPPRKSRTWMIIVAAVLGVLLLFGGTCAYVGVRVYRSVSSQSNQVADRFLSTMKTGDYDRLWNEAAPEFQKATPRDKYTAFINAVDKAVGKPVSWKATGFSTKSFVGLNGPVKTTVYTFAVKHERGDSTATITVDGQGRLMGINFNFSPAK